LATDIPRVSVIMTVRNGERYLPETISAIQAQTFKDYEVVINDNGSTDATPAILAGYAEQDARVRVIVNHAGGESTFTQGIKRALAAARAPLVAVNDADDVSSPARLETQVALLDKQPRVVLVASWYDEIDANGNRVGMAQVPVTHPALVDSCQSGNRISHSSVMYRREPALAVGGYQEQFSYASDFRLQVALMRAGGTLAVIPEPLVRIRTHAAQTSLMPGSKGQLYREPLEILLMASRLPGGSWRARLAGMIARQKLALRYGFALWQGGRRIAGVAGAARWLIASLSSPLGLAMRAPARL
jgi:glycosyltransferase involved in cell wall biosynthesis